MKKSASPIVEQSCGEEAGKLGLMRGMLARHQVYFVEAFVLQTAAGVVWG